MRTIFKSLILFIVMISVGYSAASRVLAPINFDEQKVQDVSGCTSISVGDKDNETLVLLVEDDEDTWRVFVNINGLHESFGRYDKEKRMWLAHVGSYLIEVHQLTDMINVDAAEGEEGVLQAADGEIRVMRHGSDDQRFNVKLSTGC